MNKPRTRALMVLGTASHVGKSLLTAALCRILAQQGYRVAPFKSQNMSLNSAATFEGLEIGRAQALQAEAAGIAPSVHMNPILIKPSGEISSQIVVRGAVWGQVSAADYHQRRVEELMPIVRESYETLAAEYDVIVIEGAGSPVEINLKQHDIANMRIAEMADAACLLVGDIDRGGVFASLLGTMELLEPAERERIRGFCINKFRGDLSLLMPGVRMMEERLGKPCIGVVPYLPELMLEEEDSVGLPSVSGSKWPGREDDSPDRSLRICVLAPPSFANFTDFDSLRAEPSVQLLFCRSAELLPLADAVILPGSKQTVDDLQWMREAGLADALRVYAETGLVIGICGGMQMLGEEISDPDGMERQGSVPGLGLLPIRTAMQKRKVTRLSHGAMTAPLLFGQPSARPCVSGYEIHLGQTTYLERAKPFALLDCPDGPGQPDGCISADSRIFGSYLHGLFDDDEFRHRFLICARSFHALAAGAGLTPWKARRRESLDRLARTVAAALDLPALCHWMGLPYQERKSTREGKLTEEENSTGAVTAEKHLVQDEPSAVLP